MEDRLITAEELSQYLSVPTHWVWRKVREGFLPCIRCGHFQRFDLNEVLTVLKESGNSHSDNS